MLKPYIHLHVHVCVDINLFTKHEVKYFCNVHVLQETLQVQVHVLYYKFTTVLKCCWVSIVVEESCSMYFCETNFFKVESSWLTSNKYKARFSKNQLKMAIALLPFGWFSENLRGMYKVPGKLNCSPLSATVCISDVLTEH